MSRNMCIWRNKLCIAKTSVGPTFTWSNANRLFTSLESLDSNKHSFVCVYLDGWIYWVKWSLIYIAQSHQSLKVQCSVLGPGECVGGAGLRGEGQGSEGHVEGGRVGGKHHVHKAQHRAAWRRRRISKKGDNSHHLLSALQCIGWKRW